MDRKELLRDPEKLREFLRGTWREFAVSGLYDSETGGVKKSTDVDGRSALGLFKLAGFDTSKVEYVLPGTGVEGAVNIDTGNKDGFVVEGSKRKTAYFDHHSESSRRGGSATEEVYKFLVSLGYLQESEDLKRLVEFVNREDNRAHPNEAEHFNNGYRTVLGLSHDMSFEQLYEFFKSGRKPTELLTHAELKGLGLLEKSRKHKLGIDMSWKKLEKYEKQGFIVPSKRYGKIVVDIERKLPHAFRAAKAYGAGAYLIWSPEQNSMFFSTVDKPITEKLPQGELKRETMWIKPRGGNEKLKMSLQEVLDILTDHEFSPSGKLKEYIEQSNKSS